MPELPEVETVRRTMEQVLLGRKIAEAEFVEDDIVFRGHNSQELTSLFTNRTVSAVKRHGKYWWIETDQKPFLLGHLGMAGWIRELGQPTIRLREHGNAPLEDEAGRPRFLKWLLTSDQGRRVAMTDQRRFAKVWLTTDPNADKSIRQLGPDVYNTPWTTQDLYPLLQKRKVAIKAALLDQKLFCGVGNWIADEVLYQAAIAPARLTNSLSKSEAENLLAALQAILKQAVEVGADKEQFPTDWLFHVRWGGSKGHDVISGQQIIRETIGGRTTAWVPSRQS